MFVFVLNLTSIHELLFFSHKNTKILSQNITLLFICTW